MEDITVLHVASALVNWYRLLCRALSIQIIIITPFSNCSPVHNILMNWKVKSFCETKKVLLWHQAAGTIFFGCKWFFDD